MRPPEWVLEVVGVFEAARATIDSEMLTGVTSDKALKALRPGLEALGFLIESGKGKVEKIARPVLFGENGKPVVSYEVDGFQPVEGIVLEVEAGRGAQSNADYRNLVRASLMVDARFLILAMMVRYQSGASKTTTRSYEVTRNRLDAIYASERLSLPLDGLLLIGY